MINDMINIRIIEHDTKTLYKPGQQVLFNFIPSGRTIDGSDALYMLDLTINWFVVRQSGTRKIVYIHSPYASRPEAHVLLLRALKGFITASQLLKRAYRQDALERLNALL